MKIWFGMIAGLVVLGFGLGYAHAADVTVAGDFNSAYVWRGITFNDGLVFQPSVDVASGGFGLNVWGNLDIHDYDKQLKRGDFSEIDLTMSYSKEIKGVSLSVGYIEYLFPNGGDGTREVFAGVGIAPLPGFSTQLDAYYDFDEVEDWYITLGLGYEYEIVENLSVSLGASAGYAGEDMSAGQDGGLHDYQFSLGVGYTVWETLSISVAINYVDTFDEDVLPEQDVNTYGGVSVAYAF